MDINDKIQDELEQQRQASKTEIVFEQYKNQQLKPDDYVYISKNSPCCKTLFKFTICYVVALVIVIIALIFNNNYCLFDAPIHTLKIANHTGPITYNGITTKQTNQSLSTYEENQFDYLSKFTFNPKEQYNYVYSLNESSKVRANDRTGLELSQFPLGLMINYTYADGQPFNNTLKKLVFKPNDGSYVDDNGAAIEIKISNQKRKSFRTNESWFNENYWEQYISDGSELLNDKIKQLSGCQSQYFSTNDNFTLLDSSNPYSQIPLWLINIDTLTQPKVQWCADDYNITIYVHKYFCFSPLIIRQMNYQTIEFEDIELHGQIIFDTQMIDDNESELKYKVQNSTIDYLLMTDCKQIDDKCYINFDISGSNVTLFFPDLFLHKGSNNKSDNKEEQKMIQQHSLSYNMKQL